MKKVAIYARVSTDRQTTENQIRELREVADRAGWDVVREYVDNGISGAKGKDQRPEFGAMEQAATRREFDVIMSWSVDRLGRSLPHLVQFLEDIQTKGCDLYLHKQNLDTTTPSGRAMFQMCAVFAEFDRAMMQDRIKAGLERAKAQGKSLGRPKVSEQIEDRIRELRSEGRGMLRIAKEVGCGVSTVQRVVAN